MSATDLRPHSIEWEKLRSPDFDALRLREAIVVVPVGSTEQHGPHLPVHVDSMIATEVAWRAAALCGSVQPVIVAPTVRVSLAEHHMAFGGTLTLDYDTFCAVLRCMVSSIHRQGFARILLLNGHGGNINALRPIIDQLTREMQVRLAGASYWELAADAFETILEGQQYLQHACEAETSMVLALAPKLVDLAAARCVVCNTAGFGKGNGVYRYRPIAEWAASGVVGTPHLATADKGERLLAAAATALYRALADPGIWSDATSGSRAPKDHLEKQT